MKHLSLLACYDFVQFVNKEHQFMDIFRTINRMLIVKYILTGYIILVYIFELGVEIVNQKSTLK